MEKENPKHQKQTHPCCFLQAGLKGEMVQTGTCSFYRISEEGNSMEGIEIW